MLARIKTALRITHTKLDADIQDTIDAACDELIRLGVSEDVVHGRTVDETTTYEPLIIEAVKTYCQMNYTDDEKRKEMYYKSWETQVDGLRKSRDYRKTDD